MDSFLRVSTLGAMIKRKKAAQAVNTTPHIK
jgi:hypothetical protein